MKRKVYDGCMYYNEDMLLKLRLDTLWNHVDVFVVVGIGGMGMVRLET